MMNNVYLVFCNNVMSSILISVYATKDEAEKEAEYWRAKETNKFVHYVVSEQEVKSKFTSNIAEVQLDDISKQSLKEIRETITENIEKDYQMLKKCAIIGG